MKIPQQNRNKPNAPSSRRMHGMSLLEVILAIAIAGFVLTSAVSLLVSVTAIWSDRSERHFFTDHVDGVTEFLNATFAAAGTQVVASKPSLSNDSGTTKPTDDGGGAPPEPEPTADSNNIAFSADTPIRWQRPPGFTNYSEPLLNFSMADDTPILVGLENAPALGINAFLHFEPDEGLSLLWHSMVQEEVEDINDLNRTLISPLVKKVTYIYWDERFEAWNEDEVPREGDGDEQYILPRFIKLFFEYEEVAKERTLTIPVPIRSALIF